MAFVFSLFWRTCSANTRNLTQVSQVLAGSLFWGGGGLEEGGKSHVAFEHMITGQQEEAEQDS